MKSPLVYLTAVRLKNQAKELFKKPARLIYVLFLAAMFALMAFSSFMTDGEELAARRDISELTAILVLFYTVMFLMTFVSGSAGNAAMFSMSDVNILFPSPLSPQRILFYGLLRQMGLSLLLGFFLLFQYSWLHTLYGVTYGALLAIVAGYGLILFLGQLCAMTVYSRAKDRERAGKFVKYGALAAVVVYLLWMALQKWDALSALASGSGDFDSTLSAIVAFITHNPGPVFPVSGWIGGIVDGLISGDWALCAILFGVTVLFTVLLVALITKSDASYYEDALRVAETVQSTVTAQKEGKYQEVGPKRVKLGKIGLGNGWGASAIYYKHKVENRRSGVFFLSTMSLIFVVVVIALSFFMRAIDDGEDIGATLIGVFVMSTYMQMFSATLGRFNRELLKPYLYLIPEPPLKKLLYALKENLISDCWEALVIFIPVGFILNSNPFSIAFCILARISFALLFMAGNVLVERVFGSVSSKGLVVFFYFLMLIALSLPGIVVGIAALFLLPALPGFVAQFVGMTVLNVLISLLVLYLCRNLLQYAELNN